MPELSSEDIRAIHDSLQRANDIATELSDIKRVLNETKDRTNEVAALLLGVNNNAGLSTRVEKYMIESDKRIRRLEIVVCSVALVSLSGGGIFGVIKLIG